MRGSVWVVVVALAAMTGVGRSETIEQTALRFGAREGVAQLSLSPDGSKVAYVGSVNARGSVAYTMGLAKGSKAVAALYAAGDPDRIRECHWVSNERLICTLYGVVANGDFGTLPFSRLVAVNADGSNAKVLSRQRSNNSRGYLLHDGEVVDWLPEQNGKVLLQRAILPDDHLGSHIGSDREGLGVDLVDTNTLSYSSAWKADSEAVEFISDGRGNIRIIGRSVPLPSGYASGKYVYRVRAKGGSEWATLATYDVQTDEGFRPVAIDPDKNLAYGFRKKDGRSALYTKLLDGSGTEQLVFAHPAVDVGSTVRIGRQGRVVGVSYDTDRRNVYYFDPAIRAISETLTRALPDHPLVQIVDCSMDESKLLVFAGSDRDPGVYYLYDRATKRLDTFLVAREQLEGVKLANVQPVTYPAADGTMVPGYLTLPPGGAAKGLPAIVLPHGGPEARDSWGFDWLSQFFAARGFAVLQPNFRGSAGYGDAWLKDNGFKSWRTAVDDVMDGGRWLVAQGIADPARLGILGWSYGGYAALQAAATDPALFKAVIAVAPVTDLPALKEDSRDWSNFALVSRYIGVGPHLREGSPTQTAAQIKAPVLLFHGTYDRNVRYSQSRLLRDRLAAAKVPHELVTFDKLDHYLEDSAARIQLLEKSDGFLRTALKM